MNFTRVAALILLCIGGLAHSQQAPDGLQFNVPYLCNDGNVYVVHRCEKWPKFEGCFYQHAPDSERYNTRQAVVYQMTKMCKVQGTGANGAAASTQQQGNMPSPVHAPGDVNNSRWDCGGGTGMTVIGCQKQGGREACFVRLEQGGKILAVAPKPLSEIQSKVSVCKALPQINPAYLAEFPSPYNVVAGMLVGKPQENVTRAIGAMYQLSEIIKVFAKSRALTADETKLLTDYANGQAELVRQAEKAFPGQRFDPSSNPYAFKRSDPRFGFEGIPVWVTFFTRGMQEGYARAVGGSDDEYWLSVNREKNRAMKQSEDQMKAQQAEASYAKDPGSVAARHCLESGRSEMECLGEGMKLGMNQLMGGDIQEAVIGKTPTGLRLTGVYGGNGFALNFRQDLVYVGCGSLLPEPRKYTVDRSGMQVSVTIPVTTPPLVLSYNADGSLVGGGRTIAVAGEVPAGGGGASTTYGMQTTTTTTERQLEPGEEREYSADQLHQNGGQFSVDQQTSSTSWAPSTTYQRPRTVPKTEHCTVGTLPAGSESIKTAAILTQVLGSKASKSANSKPGLRLNGTYAVAGGLKIEFRDDSATLECGESFNSEAYEVLREGGQMIVKFQNNTGPLSLILQPNNTLIGSGDVEVTGRRAIQGSGGGIDYQSRNSRCSLGTLAASK
jgi:hypothetical protein